MQMSIYNFSISIFYAENFKYLKLNETCTYSILYISCFVYYVASIHFVYKFKKIIILNIRYPWCWKII